MSNSFNPNWAAMVAAISRAIAAGSGIPKNLAPLYAVAVKRAWWSSVLSEINNSITAAGGIPDLSYPPNPRGVVLALQDLAALIEVGLSVPIPDGSITSAKIQDGTIVNGDISPSAAIALSKLASTPMVGSNNLSDISNAATARTNLGLGLIAVQSSPLPVANGGTAATSASSARSSLGAAASGANSDITSLSALSTPLSVAQGGTGSGTASGARSSLGAAASGSNADITSLSSLSTPLSVAQGGTGANSASGARTNLGLAIGTDVAAQSHVSASANVHGLPASTNVLGNRNASGEFIQRGSATTTAGLTAYSLTHYTTTPISFPVAFSSAPRVLMGGVLPAAAQSITSTGCNLLHWGDVALTGGLTIQWLAIGA